MRQAGDRIASRVRRGLAMLLVIACSVSGGDKPDVGLTSDSWKFGRGATLKSGELAMNLSGDKPGAVDAWFALPLEGDFALEVDYVIEGLDSTVLSSGIGIRLDPADGTPSLMIDRSKRGADEEYLFGLPAREKSQAIDKSSPGGSFRVVRAGAAFECFYRDDAHKEWTTLGTVATKFPAKVTLGLTAHKVGKGEFKATVKRVVLAEIVLPTKPGGEVAAKNSGKIGAAGGTIGVEGCRVDFPKDAIGADVEIAIAPAADAPEPRRKDLKLVSGCFTLSTKQTRIQAPALVTMKFDPTRLPAGWKPEDVVPVIGRGGVYEELRAESIDSAKGEITFKLRRLEPRIGYDGPDAGGPTVFGTAGYIDRLPVIHEPEFDFSAPADLPNAAATIVAVRETLARARKELESHGFVHVAGKLRIGLVPAEWIRPGAGLTCGEDLIYVDMALAGTGETFSGVLAHEYFHIVQNNSRAGYTSDAGTHVNATWLTESTAEWFTQSIYPQGHLALDRVSDMQPEFFNAPFFHGAEGSLHHYKSYAFYSFLDPQYGALKVIHAFYLDPEKAPKADPTLDTIGLLEATLAARGTTLPDVFTDFLIHAAWKKDREPFKTILASPSLERYATPLIQHLGKPGEIKSDPKDLVRWTLPFEEKGTRAFAKTFDAVAAEPYGIAKTYDIVSKTEPGEKGDLKLKLTGCPEGKLRIVAFPYSESGLAEPVIAKSGTATLHDWHKLKGAIVWVVSVTNEQRYEFRLEARLRDPDAEPVGPKTFVLKGGQPTIQTVSGATDLGKGWAATASGITHTLDTMVGPIGETKPATFTAKLSFRGPPPTLTEGQQVELSMTASGEVQADVMGEWLVSGTEGTPEGIDCVGLSPIDTRDPRPTAGTLKFKVAKSPYNIGPSITLTGDKYVRITWSYELKE